MIECRYPVVVVHGLADVRVALAPGAAVTLLSGAGAALYAGSAWWSSLMARKRCEFPDVPSDDILDCADASGLALGAMRGGQRLLVLAPEAPGWASVATVAASFGGHLFTTRPPSLDMADRGAVRRLHLWLQARTSQGDSGDAVS